VRCNDLYAACEGCFLKFWRCDKLNGIDKPFLSYKEQIARLNEKGISCNKANEKKYLIRKGYFNLINGYKKPFVISKKENGDHVYLPGTSLEKIYKVLKFDRRLSGMLLRNITHVEEEVRTISGYKFDLLCNKNKTDWTQIISYDDRADEKLKLRLIRRIKSEIDLAKDNNNGYINHYTSKYEEIPTWIMTKIIKFTTLISFIQLSKKELRVYICNLYDIEYKQNDNNFGILIGALNWMRRTRNACAHNERIIFLKDDSRIVITKYHLLLTTAYKNRLRNKQVIDLIIFLKYFNTKREFNKLINFFDSELEQIAHVVDSKVFESIRASLGIRNMEHLQILRNKEKSINYLNLL